MLDNHSDVELLSSVEAYFITRRSRQKGDVFSKSKDGVAARYARVFLQGEKEKILEKAETEKARKIATGREILNTIQGYESQKAEKRRTSCDCSNNFKCYRCRDIQRFDTHINNVKHVSVYEWPLPEDTDLADVVVFFQHPPEALKSLLDMYAIYKLFQSKTSSSHQICMLLAIT